ncbi:MAG: hypothetical protein ACTJIB_10520 [Pseudoalteromonas prydzensis]|uniref:hypothetical protein n=1 Tax=Pseudoalteromonas prydzensis TaxID=182141 RepID=UPI003F9BA2B6
MNIITAASMMLDTGKYFNASDLARFYRVTEPRAKSWLDNIRKEKRFETVMDEVTGKIKVISIDNRKRSIDKLQSSVLLMKRPSL